MHARRGFATSRRPGCAGRFINQHSEAAIDPRLGTVIPSHAIRCSRSRNFCDDKLTQLLWWKLLMMAKNRPSCKGRKRRFVQGECGFHRGNKDAKPPTNQPWISWI